MYNITRTVRYQECDSLGNFSIYAIPYIITDMMSEFTKTFNMDNFTLREKYNLMWVFTKHKIDLYKYVKWNHEIKISMRVEKVSKVKAYFYTTFKDFDDSLIASSLLECCVITCDTFKFSRLDNFDINVEEEPNLDLSFETINEDDLRLVSEFNVTNSEIDYSMHMTNAEYARRIRNIKPFNIKHLELHYILQAKLNEKVFIYESIKDNKTSYIFKDQNDKTILKSIII